VKSLPYTRTGDIILACNPYQWFHDLYSEKVRNHYSQALVWNAQTSATTSANNKKSSPHRDPIRKSQNLNSVTTPSKPSATANDPRTTLSPHVYETSCMAYKGLLRDEEDQSILVSGESGAGKTETVKILLRNLADIQEGGRQQKRQQQLHETTTGSTTESPQDNIIVQRVLDSNPLLEAFGNATTLRNDNSSRFGKYLQLQFDTTSSSSTTSAPAILAGSKCEVYLLEKSRVTHHHVSERTYHIFYQLLAAPEELKVAIWDGLADTDVESFCYVGWTESDSPTATQGIIEGKTDAERFQLTLQALELIGVRGGILQMLLRAICVVLQLGNLEFSPAQPSDATGMLALGIHHRPGGSSGGSGGGGGGDDGQHSDASVISSVEELQELSELMGMSDVGESDNKISKALQTALTVRNVEARGEVFAVPLTSERAKESADAFAKEIYAKTFLWLVRTINDATCAEKNYSGETSNSRSTKSSAAPLTNFGIIGLLDIFGFETFEVNRFEQLCINYCNEKLQQKFTQDIFRSVQVEYENEGIELEEITYDDNTDVLDLVEGRMGLLAFLNEECVRPKGSDKTFVYKAQALNRENPCFFRDKHAKDTEFGICHYAGRVVYDATEFVVKNTDTLPSDLLDCAKLSSNAIIAKELTNDTMMNPSHVNSITAAGASAKKKKRPKSAQSPSLSHPQLQRRTSNLVAETVWTKFKNQLSQLMEALSETKTRYIRCIKPNGQKAPLLMEHISTVEQLRCAGVVAAVTISRSAFPNRLEHLSVLDRFKSLWPKGDHIVVLQDHDLDPEERRRKATEILLTIALKEMEFEKNGLNLRAFVMGKTRAYFRAGALEFLEAERLKHLGIYATVVQTASRGFVLRSKYRRHRRAVIVLQAHYRRMRQQRKYIEIRQAAVHIECWYRFIFAARTVYHLRRTIRATSIQTRWRIYRDTRRLKSVIVACVVVQAMVRGSLQRPRYRQALIDKREEAKLENQLRALQKKLEEAEAKRVDAERQTEERVKAAVEQFKEKEFSPAHVDGSINDEAEAVDKEAVETATCNETAGQSVQDLTAEQQRLMDESGKMLESLRKEVFKLRSQNQQLRTDFDLLKDNNQRLMDANASAGASFAALNQHAKQLSKQNAALVNEVQNLKGQVHKLNIQQVELKDELRFKTATYVAEVQSRLNFQKALQKITDIISESCRDHRLVERVLTVADEVEMDFMTTSGESAPDNHTDDEMENPGNSSRGGILGFFFS
jgi:myosin V